MSWPGWAGQDTPHDRPGRAPQSGKSSTDQPWLPPGSTEGDGVGPKAGADVVEGGAAVAVEGQVELDDVAVVEVATAMPTG